MPDLSPAAMTLAMKEAFRESLIAHIATYRISIAKLSRETGVSLSLIQSLNQRKSVCPNVDDAIKLARYFGKSVEEFVGVSRDDQEKRLRALISRLTEGEKDFLEAQLTTLAARQGREKPSPLQE